MKSIVSLLIIVVVVVVVSLANSSEIRNQRQVVGETNARTAGKTEIIVESLNGHIIKLLADLDETVKEFKGQIEKLIHVPVISQTLWLKGKGPSDVTYLENHHTLKSYGMHQDSLVVITAFFDLEHRDEADIWVPKATVTSDDKNELNIIVKFTDGGVMGALKAKASDTVGSLIEQIKTNFNLDGTSVWLIHNTKPLHDDRTLGSYNITDGAIVVSVDWSGEPYGNPKVTGMFWLESLDSGAFTKIQLQLSDTVASIKSWIENKLHVKADCQYLIYDHQMLDDDKQTIEQLNVRNNSQMAWVEVPSQCRH